MSEMRLAPLCTNGHGARRRVGPHGPLPRLLVWIALLSAGAMLASSSAHARDPGPRVLWAAGERLYIAVPDSGALAVGMRVRVLDREREVGRGEVADLLDGIVAGVRLDTPLDGRVRLDQLDRLDVMLEAAPQHAVPTLRMGLPAPGRRALAPPCDDARLDAAALPRAYREERLASDAVRFVAEPLVADSGRAAWPEAQDWPETLLVRTFADRADEEIALERGELDAAVFWPGEAPARLRDRAAGFEVLRGLRSSGAIVVRSERNANGQAPRDPGAARATAADLAALNAELFAGDLLPLALAAGASAADPAASVRSAIRLVDYRVDPGLPGARAIGRFLNRESPLSPARERNAILEVVRVTYHDESGAPPDTVGEGASADGATTVFALRCPIICSAARAADVRLLGADRFADLIACGRRGGAR